MLVLELLNQLGWDGFRQHAREVRDFYRQRRDQMCALAEKYLRGKFVIIAKKIRRNINYLIHGLNLEMLIIFTTLNIKKSNFSAHNISEIF